MPTPAPKPDRVASHHPAAPPSLHQSKPVLACPYCGGKHITKNGVRKNKYGTARTITRH